MIVPDAVGRVAADEVDELPRRARRDFLVACIPGAFLGAVTLLLTWPVLLGRTMSAVPGMQAMLWPWRGVVDDSPSPALQADGAASSYPWSVSYHDALRQLELPFWDWHSFTGGYDLASNGVAGAMYPVHWLLWLVFEPARAHDAYVILHLWVGGLVMFLLLRHWKMAVGPALVGATAWMLAPFNVGWLQAEMITPVLVVVPLVFLSVSAALAVGSWQRILGASAALALAMVAGNIVVFLVVVWVAGLYAATVWLALARRRPASELRRMAATLALVAVGGFALSAYSLVPTLLNILDLSRRPPQLSEVLPSQASVSEILSTLWSPPDLDTSVSLFELHWPGRTTLLLAVVGLLHRSGIRVLGLLLVLFFTLLPVTPLLVQAGWFGMPPLRAVAGFGRLAFLGAFGIAILAAAGSAVLLALLSHLWARSSAVREPRHLHLLAGTLVASVVVVELLPFARTINPPWTDLGDTPLMPTTAALDALATSDDEWPSLVLPISSLPEGANEPTGYSLWGATAHAADVDSVGGYDSAVPTRATALTQVMQGVPAVVARAPIAGAYLPNFNPQWTRLDLAERFGVTHVYSPPGVDPNVSAYAMPHPRVRLVHDAADGRVWKLEDPMRGPRLVGRATYVTSPRDALVRFVAPKHDARAVVVLEGRPPADDPGPGRTDDDPGTVRSATRGNDRATVEVDVRRPMWLVMPIGYAAGWRAQSDGQPLSIRPADGAMSAVRVPPGRHTVTFTYRPRGFIGGALVTLAALLTAFGFLVASRLPGLRHTWLTATRASRRRKER